MSWSWQRLSWRVTFRHSEQSATGFAPIFKGVRTFVLTPRNDGSTDFVMEERFSGLILPLVKGSMPDFGPVFERYANDLKREAEQVAQ